jgi:hypothetical protein
MTRRLFLSARPALATSLVEQFDAIGGFALPSGPLAETLAPPWPDAVVLDADFCDAAAIAARLREDGFSGAVVVISNAADPCPHANATLTRPFHFFDLLDCVEAPREPPKTPDGVDLRLTEKEAAILERLAQAAGATIPKAALLAEIWGYGPNVSTRTLETHIHRLRRKIELSPGHPRKLITDDGGYRLAKVEEDCGHTLRAP